MEAIILAGGFGTRLRARVADLPKPMAPIRGIPFLEYLLHYWVGHGVRRFILATGYRGEKIRAHFGNAFEGAAIAYSPEQEPLGTGGATVQAAKQLEASTPFLLLNGDSFFAIPLKECLAKHSEHGSTLTIAMTNRAQRERAETMKLEGDRIVAIHERATGGTEEWANGGVYLVETSSLAGIKPESKSFSWEYVALPALLKNGDVITGFRSSSLFIDIGVPREYDRSQELLAPFSPASSRPLRRSS